MDRGAAMLLASSTASAVAVSGRNTLTDTTDASTYTFSNVSGLGTHTHVFLLISLAGNGPTISSVTVEGNAATSIVSANNGNQRAAIYAIADSTATPDIVVNLSTSPRNIAVGVVAATGVNSLTAVATNSSSAGPATINANTSAGGIALACGVTTNGGTMGWTGVTEAYDTALEATDVHTGGDALTASAETPRTITGTWSSAFVAIAVSATFR